MDPRELAFHRFLPEKPRCFEDPGDPIYRPGILDTIPKMKERCPLDRVVAFVHTENDLRSSVEAGADLIMRVGTHASEFNFVPAVYP